MQPASSLRKVEKFMQCKEKNQSTQSIAVIKLLKIAPLGILNEIFPAGVPVAPTCISIDGWECYEFDPKILQEEQDRAIVDAAVASDDYPLILCLGLLKYGSVAIPLEWCEVSR